MMMHEIYGLKLLEKWAPNNNEVVTRVPGGWVFSDMQGSCFVPFNNEFQASGTTRTPVPKYHCTDCGAEMNEGEGKTFTVCSKCWDKHVEKNPSPVPKEAEYEDTGISVENVGQSHHVVMKIKAINLTNSVSKLLFPRP
jgi:DNA-directed RNA polymerase subunit RPC12/RpoP